MEHTADCGGRLPECSGVKIQYKDVSRLGVDRWLAMLAAFNQSNGPCLILDSGTAFPFGCN
ncbi:MAG: hypothetical protein Ct9H90mP27_2920 [Gammaproteobacteria bacterium]|nr:MAG: hypothetical protein Ct9H90mP27_2920 [Gammaproteobacteria bacterium]